MERIRVEKTFYWKISCELKMFKHQILQKEKEEIFAEAHKIDSIVRIYELLVEIGQKLEMEVLKHCLQISGLLTFLYEEWMKMPACQREELGQGVKTVITNMRIQTV